jgi:hypothetical protein
MRLRVQLMGNPTVDEYDALHTIMAGHGFYRTLNGVDNNRKSSSFKLPHGVYYGSSEAGPTDLRSEIVDAVKAGVQPKIIVFVVQAVTWAIGW